MFDGRSFIKAATGGTSSDTKSKQRNGDFDLDLKLGAVAGFNGEAVRGVDVKLSRRNGLIKTFSLNGKIGSDTPVTGDLRGRNVGREVMFLKTSDAGAMFRFTDIYSKMYGGDVWIAMDPPTVEATPQEGLINVRDFIIRGSKMATASAEKTLFYQVAVTALVAPLLSLAWGEPWSLHYSGQAWLSSASLP